MEDIQMTADCDSNISLFRYEADEWLNFFVRVVTILIFLLNVFLIAAIFLDRKSHGKTRTLSLLNYMLNYALFALLYYFQNVHARVTRDLSQSSCLFIILSYAFLKEGHKYSLFPVCIDFIVKYFKPSKYENKSFLRTQFILIGIFWAFVLIKELVIILAFSEPGAYGCSVHLHINSKLAAFVIAILLTIAMLVFIGLLIYIAIKGKECEMMKSPLITFVIFVILVVILHLGKTLFYVGLWGAITYNIFFTYKLVHFVGFLLLPFLWFFDATIRRSIRKLCSGKRKKTVATPSLELTTELN
ncbi:uncharacterized protein LOC118766695 [Octopus sinensis]|uniref:Uncharacterized protein LOC118766695 n=1 Tax=Octopus sinensis TaxID=2607531 RepID=A0A7E6FH73_9MOLL|nr:uncharacterized protein LOC118766695 [Octopus sinensis]